MIVILLTHLISLPYSWPLLHTTFIFLFQQIVESYSFFTKLFCDLIYPYSHLTMSENVKLSVNQLGELGSVFTRCTYDYETSIGTRPLGIGFCSPLPSKSRSDLLEQKLNRILSLCVSVRFVVCRCKYVHTCTSKHSL